MLVLGQKAWEPQLSGPEVVHSGARTGQEYRVHGAGKGGAACLGVVFWDSCDSQGSAHIPDMPGSKKLSGRTRIGCRTRIGWLRNKREQ